MNLPKWSVFASIAVVVIAVVIIVIPDKNKQGSTDIVSTNVNTAEVNEEQKNDDVKETNPIQSVINTDLEPESYIQESLKTSDTDDKGRIEEIETTDELVKLISFE